MADALEKDGANLKPTECYGYINNSLANGRKLVALGLHVIAEKIWKKGNNYTETIKL